ncbi:Thebaine 6-O-demethylase, partial [Durusdinium trenchii]
HGKLRHKVGALLHQVKLEVGFNAPSLSAYLRNVVGICTDQGVKHNMDNTCKDIWESVQGQADYSKNLRALESLLAPVPTRDKIIEVFFADPLDELDAQTASKLRVKLHYWQELPWKLLGINMPNLELARCVAVQCQHAA